jgi:hypothetical protein
LKCPKCNDDMMVLCRKSSSGFLNELYYRCLTCGFTPEDGNYMTRTKSAAKKSSTRGHALPKSRAQTYFWNAATATVLATLVLVATMQVPITTTVFATQTSLDPVKDILPYIRLLNFTMPNGFTFNYSEAKMSLRISASSATVVSTESAQNVTTSKIILQKVLLNYTDTKRSLKMGIASLTVYLTIRYEAMIARINGTAVLPLWTAILNRINGQLP